MNIADALENFEVALDGQFDKERWLKILRNASYEEFSKAHYGTKVVNWSPYAILISWLIAAFFLAMLFTVVPLAMPVLAALAAVTLVGAILTTVIMGKIRYNAYASLKHDREQVAGNEELVNEAGNKYKVAGIINHLSTQMYFRGTVQTILNGKVGEDKANISLNPLCEMYDDPEKLKRSEDEMEGRLRDNFAKTLKGNQKEYPKYLKVWHLKVDQYKNSPAVSEFVAQYSKILQMTDKITEYFKNNRNFRVTRENWEKHTGNILCLKSGFLTNLSKENWEEQLEQSLRITAEAPKNKNHDIAVIAGLITKYNQYLADPKFRKPLVDGLELHNGKKVEALIEQAKREKVDSEHTDVARSYKQTSKRR